ncbi:metal dependent phosphohydrolase [Methanococcus vannielii SB]|uniref:Metal dependent phosphohydrolase n=2 Tax=Methanococcus vannielii TaxID=2187 RepID=A6UR15_METVS|nr:HDIG domain-containing metalloprotein [Methanococcus vannielii]ABR54937.1 metal dependent phosphohydrolase [Methanococcus vannielii SB]
MTAVFNDILKNSDFMEKFQNFKNLIKVPKFNEYLLFLTENCENNVVLHSIAVSDYVYDFGIKIRKNGNDFDIETAVLGALLHDIGRSKSNYIDHGIVGAEILRKNNFNEKFAKIAERHIGAGISKEEAVDLNLPKIDYIPETIEEKVIANADNLIFNDKRVSIELVIDKFRKRTNVNVVNKVLLLYHEVDNLLK